MVVTEVRWKGKTIRVWFNTNHNDYSVFVDGIRTQKHINAHAVMRYLGNALEDNS